MKLCDFYFHVFTIFMCWKFQVNNGQNERPRGVSLSNGPLYSDSQYFTCLDGSLTILKRKVNDDYCDCEDGTDEPGTAACPSGRFHCSNRGYRPKYIPSSRVNDGICDCCDASDEYGSSMRSVCQNTCKELGKADMLAKNQEAVTMNEGFEIREGYIKTAQDTHAERKQSLERLKEELEQIEQLKDEKEQSKEAAEAPEQEARDRHKAAWEVEKAAKQAVDEKEHAADAFTELDQDRDGRVTFEEIQLHIELDPDNADDFTGVEALGLLNNKPEVFQEDFADNVWPNIKEKYSSEPMITDAPPETVEPTPAVPPVPEPPANSPPGPNDGDFDEEATWITDAPPEAVEPTPAVPPIPEPQANSPPGPNDDDYNEEATFPEEDDYEEEDYEEDYDDDDRFDEDDDDDDDEEVRKYNELQKKQNRKNQSKKDDDEDMPEYDDYTKELIKIADEARAEYDEVDKKMKDIEKEISNIERKLDVDLGADNEFIPLQGECFEYTDREYTYKLCPFDKSSQRSKNGGSETSLGKWGEWSGPADNKYSEMKYTGGLSCWNGPNRSCVVKLKCGKENQLLSASEPEKCVYEFSMATPALCNKKIDISSGNLDGHDEL